MFATLEAMLMNLSSTMPLEWFVFIASIVEEIIAPIPSPTVMVLSGSFASVQQYGVHGLLLLACIGAIGKTVGALVVYWVSYYAEGLVLNKFGKFFGVSQEAIEHFGTKIGTGYRGYASLTLFRALPIVPSVIVSVGSGVLKIPLRIFIVSAFFGTIVRDGFYLYAGYAGTQALGLMVDGTVRIENLVQYIAGFVIVLGIGYVIYRKRSVWTQKK